MAWYNPVSWAKGGYGLAEDAWNWGVNAVDDSFSADNVNPYNPNFENFTYNPAQQGDLDLARQRSLDAISGARSAGQSALAAGNTMAATAAGTGDALYRGAAEDITRADARAGYVNELAGGVQYRGAGIASPLENIAGRYGPQGTDAQTSAMGTMGSIAAGDTQPQRQMGDITSRLTGMGSESYTNPFANYDPGSFNQGAVSGAGLQRTAGVMSSMGQGDIAGQYGGISRLEDYAGRGMGPSAAEAQLLQGQDRAIAGQMALSRSGRGGASSAAARQAMANAAGIQQQTSAEMAGLRAQEEAAWRQQQLSALGVAQGARGTLGGQQLGALQGAANTEAAALGVLGANADRALAGRQAEENLRLQALGMGAENNLAFRGQSIGALQNALSGAQYGGGLQLDAAGSLAGAGAGYAAQGANVAGQAIGATQAQMGMNDSYGLGMRGIAGSEYDRANALRGMQQEGALGSLNAANSATQFGITSNLSHMNAANTAGMGYGDIVRSMNAGDLNSRGAYETNIGNWAIGAGSVNTQADTQRDAANIALLSDAAASAAGAAGNTMPQQGAAAGTVSGTAAAAASRGAGQTVPSPGVGVAAQDRMKRLFAMSNGAR